MSVASRCLASMRSCSGASGRMFSTSSTVNVPTSSGARLKRSATAAISVEQIAGPVGMGVVIEVTRIEHRVQQLLLGFEVMQQPRGGDAGFAGDLGERRVAPAVAREQALRDVEDPLLAVLALGEKRVVWPCDGHRTPSPDPDRETNLVNTQ